MSFDLDIDLDPALSMLDAGLAATRAGLRTAAEILSGELLDRARAKADGDMLQVSSGDYLRSLQAAVSVHDDHIGARLSSDAPGAGLLEYGGELPAHDILPSAGQALRFMGSAGEVYASIFHVPAVEVKPHPVIHAAFDEMRDEIVHDLEDAGRSGW